MTTAPNYAQRIIEEYKKHESARITQTIHAATALAGGALYKNEYDANAYLYILAILLSASAYGFWYICEIAHARTALWIVQFDKSLEEAKARPSYAAGRFGQVATFAVILMSFASTLTGLSFDFILREELYFDATISFAIVVGVMIAIIAVIVPFFVRVMKID